MTKRQDPLLIAMLLLPGLCVSACFPTSVPLGSGKPQIVLLAPAHGSEFRVGENVAVQSASTDASGIARVELLIDGALVQTDSPPNPQTSFSLVQNWRAYSGSHTLAVRAYNTRGVGSDMAAVTIAVAAVATPLPVTKAALPSSTPAPTVAPTLSRSATPSPTRPKPTMPARLQEDTFFEGKKDYACDARSCWRVDGQLSNQPDYFYPELNANNGDIQALLNSIGLPANQTADDREKWRRTTTVWAWLTKNIIREGRPNREPAWDYLNSLMKVHDRWPSIGDLALVFKRYGGMVWGACNSRAFTLAMLLYRVGIRPDDMTVVTAQWKQEYSQHLYVVLRTEDGWHYLDPTCNEGRPALSASPESVGCNTADYVHPNTVHPLQGSTLAKPMLVR